MKNKFKFLFLLLFLPFLFYFSSCTKDNINDIQVEQVQKGEEVFNVDLTEQTSKEDIFVENDYLVFADENAMEAFIHLHEAQQTDVLNIEKIYGYKSFLLNAEKNEFNKLLLSAKYFAAILNEKGVMAVGDYVMKQNNPTEQVFIIKRSESKTDIEKMIDADIEQNLPNNAFALSYYDYVFDKLNKIDLRSSNNDESVLVDSYQSFTKYQNNCSVPHDPNHPTTTHRAFVTARYSHLGAWHFLSADFLHVSVGGGFSGPTAVNYDIIWHACIKRFGQKPKTAYRGWVCAPPPSQFLSFCYPENAASESFYVTGASGPIENYWLKASARVSRKCDQNNYSWTGWAEIGSQCRNSRPD